MGHGTDKHLEHAEHVQHQAHDPFDRRVAMSMAIIAAALAGLTLLSHRGHTRVLQLTTQANIHKTEANTLHTKESDAWAFYQAKNIRSHEFQAYALMAKMLGKGDDPDMKEARNYWIAQLEKYEGAGYWKSFQQYIKDPEHAKRPRGKDGELEQLRKNAEALKASALEKSKLAVAKERESHEVHKSVNFIDYGHLAIEMALVICSVAVLTKQRSFWYTGMLIAVIGLGIASVGAVPYVQGEIKEAQEHASHDDDHNHDGDHKKDGGHKPESEPKKEGKTDTHH
jgi:hypothetical protein